MSARFRKRPLEAALPLSCAIHIVILAALLRDAPHPPPLRLVALPPMDVVLARASATTKVISKRGGPAAAPRPVEPTLNTRSSADVAAPSPVGSGLGAPAAAELNTRQLTAALRNSPVACPLLGAVFVDRAARVRCNDRLGPNLAQTRRIDGIPPQKAALYDEVAFEQEEARAFSYRPTASTVRPAGAGEIAGGPASDEIFSHNVGDPSPPKDPLLRREAKRLGPAIP